MELKDLHIERAYLSSELVRELPDRLEVYRKAWAVHDRGRYPKTACSLDWERGLPRCPAGVQMPFEVGGVVRGVPATRTLDRDGSSPRSFYEECLLPLGMVAAMAILAALVVEVAAVSPE